MDERVHPGHIGSYWKNQHQTTWKSTAGHIDSYWKNKHQTWKSTAGVAYDTVTASHPSRAAENVNVMLPSLGLELQSRGRHRIWSLVQFSLAKSLKARSLNPSPILNFWSVKGCYHRRHPGSTGLTWGPDKHSFQLFRGTHQVKLEPVHCMMSNKVQGKNQMNCQPASVRAVFSAIF